MAASGPSPFWVVVGLLAFVAFSGGSLGGEVVEAAPLPGVLMQEGVDVEVATTAGSSDEAIILPSPRKGVKRALVGAALLALALWHFYAVTYPRLFPKYKKALMYGHNFAAQLIGEEPQSEAEFTAKRYIDYATKDPEGATLEAVSAFAGLILLLNGVALALQPGKRRIVFKKRN